MHANTHTDIHMNVYTYDTNTHIDIHMNVYMYAETCTHREDTRIFKKAKDIFLIYLRKYSRYINVI